MKDDAKLRAELEKHLENALAIARDLGDWKQHWMFHALATLMGQPSTNKGTKLLLRTGPYIR
jgi:hypothetical protein